MNKYGYTIREDLIILRVICAIRSVSDPQGRAATEGFRGMTVHTHKTHDTVLCDPPPVGAAPL